MTYPWPPVRDLDLWKFYLELRGPDLHFAPPSIIIASTTSFSSITFDIGPHGAYPKLLSSNMV